MNKYKYKAKDQNNKIIKGVIYTESKEELRIILESKKLYLIKCRLLLSITNIYKKSNLSDFVFLCNQISIMLDAGLEFDKIICILKGVVKKTYLICCTYWIIQDILTMTYSETVLMKIGHL